MKMTHNEVVFDGSPLKIEDMVVIAKEKIRFLVPKLLVPKLLVPKLCLGMPAPLLCKVLAACRSNHKDEHNSPPVSTCRRFKLKAKHIRLHSPAVASKPRRENCRNPIVSLMIPITGSTVHFRKR